MNPICPYCNAVSELVLGRRIYPHIPKIHDKKYYLCAPCKAWVGCHPDSDTPLGTLADAYLRAARSEAHKAFDTIWRQSVMSRTQAYAWLSKEMNVPPAKCHIGMFDMDQCRRVVALCSSAFLN